MDLGKWDGFKKVGNELMSLDFVGFGWWVSNGLNVTPRFPVRPDWRIRTGFRDARLKTGTPYLIFFF